MQSAGAGAGPVGLRPGQGAPVLSTRQAEEAGCGITHGLRQPNGSSGARTHPVQRENAEPRGALVPCVVHPGNQTVRSWGQNPSVASGESLFPVTPDSAGFITEARGTCQTGHTAVMVSQGGVGSSGPLSEQPSQVSGASGVNKPANPLFKPPKYDGSKCLETFLRQFNFFASYMQWEEADKFLHMCASLDGPAGDVLRELPQVNPATQDIERLLQARFGTQLQAESYRAKLRNRRRAKGESLQDLYRDISRLIQLAHPGEGDELVKYVGVESFINALDDRYPVSYTHLTLPTNREV